MTADSLAWAMAAAVFLDSVAWATHLDWEDATCGMGMLAVLFGGATCALVLVVGTWK